MLTLEQKAIVAEVCNKFAHLPPKHGLPPDQCLFPEMVDSTRMDMLVFVRSGIVEISTTEKILREVLNTRHVTYKQVEMAEGFVDVEFTARWPSASSKAINYPLWQLVTVGVLMLCVGLAFFQGMIRNNEFIASMWGPDRVIID